MSTCDLCDLPTPDPPVEGAGGEFCCRGCREVASTLESADLDAGSVRERARSASERTPAVPDGHEEAFLAVDGMHCTTCEAFLAVRGERHGGITAVTASYATGTVRVVYDPDRRDPTDLPELLSGHGYVARFRDEAGRDDDDAELARLLVGGFCTFLLMPWYLFFLYPSYVGIETGILTVDMRSSIGLYLPMAVVGVLSTVVLFYTGYPVLRGAYVSVLARRPNMDLLISVAALSAYAYSTVALATGSTHLYYDVSVAVIMVVTVGGRYEGTVRRRATALLSAVTTTSVEEARRRTDDGTETVPLDDLRPGDELLVRPGERIPADGTVIDGRAAVDESLLTGESVPRPRTAGDEVIGGSVATDGALVVVVGEDADSTLDRIGRLMWELQSADAGVQRLVDRLSTIFVPIVLVLAVIVTGWRLWAGASGAEALLAGLTVLVVSCPCAMGLATPLAIAGGLRDALERGIVVADESLFEAAPDADVVVFDKTGTLTAGEMAVRAVHGDPAAVERAAAVEELSEHPVASAIVEYANASQADRGHTTRPDGGTLVPEPTGFERHPGEGVSAHVDGDRVVVGRPSLVERLAGSLDDDLHVAVEDARSEGSLPIAIGWGGRGRAVVVLADESRTEWTDAVDAVADREVIVLTGDDPAAADRFRAHPAIDEVFAGVPPDGKVETVRRLRSHGTVAMVGDGTNDAPALAAADVGIAMGDGTASAADAADVVVASNDLNAVREVFALASGTRRRVRENVCWALCYNAIAIPLAVAGVINPLFAALAMATSSVLVVTNSSRPVIRE